MRALLALVAAALGACAHSGAPPAASAPAVTAASLPAGDATAAAASVDAQIADGAKLYAEHCAKCHGADGQGGKKAPPLVGPTALPLDPPAAAKKRTMPFRTAADVLKFAKKFMPNDDPGSLTDDQYNAVLAFVLKANRGQLERLINADTAADITLH